MNIFITGATGYIGFAVASTLAAKGHQVYGLVRSEEKMKKLEAAEIHPVLGSMGHPSSYAKTANFCEVLIHCAADFSESFHQLDRKTAEVLIRTASETELPRKIIYTSGVWVYGNTQEMVDESSALNPPQLVQPRAETEKLILNATKNNLSTLVLRPGCVYGGRGGLTASWFDSAIKEGAATLIGDGHFRWAMVHIEDLADAYVRAAESSLTKEVFNVTDRSRSTILECAQTASRIVQKHAKIKSIPLADAAKTMGDFAECLTLNQHVDSSKAARLLGWQPRHGGFVDGADRYFKSWKASDHVS